MDMRDPTTANCRIYIGNLPDNSRKDVEEHFSKYGQIMGIVINRGFGFVQFDRPDAVENSIQNEDGTMFMGRKIIVRTVTPNNNDSGKGQGNDGNNQNQGRNRNRGGKNRGGRNSGGSGGPWNNERDRSPLDSDRNMGGGGGMDGMGGSGGMNSGPNIMNSGMGGMNSGPGVMNSNQVGMNQGGSGVGMNVSTRSGGGNGGMGSGRDDWPPARDNFGQFGNQPGHFNMSARHDGYQNENFPPPPDHNDCEIIVVSRTLTGYAEMIESHLKRRGLSVDLLFPNDDVPIGKVLANISSRGTLYAILVTPQNEEHRSITVNILYGTPAEHRNMPVDDALNFIVVNFQTKLKCDKAGVAVPVAVPITPTSAVAPPLSERHPDPIQVLLNLLANNRPLTVLQYDRIIQYLEERRELQKRAEIGDDDIVKPVKTNAPNPEEELQKKIMSILNKPSIMAAAAPEPVKPTPSASSSGSSSQLLHDPKVQKALDSLLGGNFKF